MGCGGSKHNPNANPLPVKIRPLLMRRFDELRRKSRNAVSSSSSLAADHSKKELLKDAVISEDDSSAHRNVVDDDMAKEVQPSSPRSPRVAPEPEHEPEKLLKQRSMLTIDTGDRDRFREDGIYPGSPSFRFYFIESSLTNEEDEDHEIDADVEHSDKENDESEEHSRIDQSSSVNSELATKAKMKTGRVHRLRKAIPRGRKGAVKNLLNVRSCYNPSRGGHQDNASLLLRQKTLNSI